MVKRVEYKKGDMASFQAFIAYSTQEAGKKFDIKIESEEAKKLMKMVSNTITLKEVI